MQIDSLKRKANESLDQLISWRRAFHQFPELGLECERTASIVTEHLRDLGLVVKTGIAKTGVVGIIRGVKEGPVVALRVDMDALPLQEQTCLPFASKVPNVMHACGHDGHTAIGLGVAKLLAEIRDSFPGTVKIIFQPGEESPGGAKLMIEEGVLNDPTVEVLLGCHIHPSLTFGAVGVCYGTVTAGNYEFEITLKGVGGHAARPHKCRDPVAAAGHLIVAIQTIVSRRADPLEPLVISIGEIHGGSSSNVIPEKVVLRGIIRYVTEQTKDLALSALKEVLAGIQSCFGIDLEFRTGEEDPPMRVNNNLVSYIEKVSVELLGAEKVRPITQPSMGAEDFAFYTGLIPCAYLRFGCFDRQKSYIYDLHNPHFDFDEAILALGTETLTFLILTLLTSNWHGN